MMSTTKLAELFGLRRQADEAFETQGMEALKEAFMKMFNENPTVIGCQWTQYTPYFKDGDACHFRVGEFYWKTGDSKDFVYNVGDKLLEKILVDFEAEVADTQFLLTVFGDHKKITVTREGFQIDDYGRHD